MPIVHHHLVYQAHINRTDLNKDCEDILKNFLYDLVSFIDMHVLIPPQVAFSHQKAWTGIVGIVTSHISFHYWTIENYLQLDIYSCKEFNIEKTILFLNEFWKSNNIKTLFFEREVGKDFTITSN